MLPSVVSNQPEVGLLKPQEIQIPSPKHEKLKEQEVLDPERKNEAENDKMKIESQIKIINKEELIKNVK